MLGLDVLDSVIHKWMQGLNSLHVPSDDSDTDADTDSDTDSDSGVGSLDIEVAAPTTREPFSGRADDDAQDVRRMSATRETQPTDGAPAAFADPQPGRTSAPSPWSDPVYNGFVDIVRGTAAPREGDGAGSGGSPGSTYQRLMATEGRVLDTVDRVVNDARYLEARDTSFMQQSLSTILQRVARALLDAFEELLLARSIADVTAVFRKKDRILYFGLAAMGITLIVVLLGGFGDA